MSKKKECYKCGKSKLIEEFNWRDKGKGKRSIYCKLCSKENRKKWYRNSDHRKKHIESVKRNSKKVYIETRKWIWKYFEEHPCIDCGERDPVVLEFDHRSREGKLFEVGGALGQRGWQSILKEIEKCDVRCANCHKRRTAKQRDFYKYISV